MGLEIYWAASWDTRNPTQPGTRGTWLGPRNRPSRAHNLATGTSWRGGSEERWEQQDSSCGKGQEQRWATLCQIRKKRKREAKYDYKHFKDWITKDAIKASTESEEKGPASIRAPNFIQGVTRWHTAPDHRGERSRVPSTSLFVPLYLYAAWLL